MVPVLVITFLKSSCLQTFSFDRPFIHSDLQFILYADDDDDDGVRRCVEVCGGVRRCVEVCVQRCAEVCRGVWRCADVCGRVWTCAEVCGGVWTCVDVCGGVRRCVEVCGGVFTWGYSERNLVLLTEARRQDGVRGGVVAEVVGAIDQLRAVDTDH